MRSTAVNRCTKSMNNQVSCIAWPAATQFKQPVHRQPGSPSSQALATMVSLQNFLLTLLATLLHHDGTAVEHNDEDLTEEEWPSDQGEDSQRQDQQWSSGWNEGWNQWWHGHWNWGWPQPTQQDTATAYQAPHQPSSPAAQEAATTPPAASNATPVEGAAAREQAQAQTTADPRDNTAPPQQQPQSQPLVTPTTPNEAMTWAEWAWHRPQPGLSPSHAVRHRPWWDTNPIDRTSPQATDPHPQHQQTLRGATAATRTTSRQRN